MKVSGTGNFMGDNRDPEDWSSVYPAPLRELERFYRAYAMPLPNTPSCLVCGRNDYKQVAIKHTELPSVVVCLQCRDRAMVAAAPSEIARDAARLDWIDANVKITERVKGWTSERWRWSLALPAADNIRAAIDAAIEQEEK
jgi:transcription elongation factor Elf1